MYEEAVFEALSSKPRMDIIKQLYRKPLGIQELSEKLKLQPITIRHHIHSLLEAGLLESYEERSGVAGRPKNYYKISKSLPLVSFPERKYLTLSSSLIDALRVNIGEKEAKELLAKIGREMGAEVVKQLERDYAIENWSPEDFQRLFIEKYLEDMGARPEVTERTPSRVTYRLHNCIFYELAQSMPNMMCDVLHNQFHVGVVTTIGKQVKDKQTTCMGHGDGYCEHIVEWRK
jgi:predicted ArsR family transcriptional regulator